MKFCIFFSSRTQDIYKNPPKGMYDLINAPINIPMDPPPHNLTIFKGYKENILSRQSASFFIRSQMAQDFLNWLYDAACPEEFFYATLARVSQDQYFYKGQISQGNYEFYPQTFSDSGSSIAGPFLCFF